MKTAVFASALFASLALAAPLNKRAYATKTHTVVETVMVYTTVFDGQQSTEVPVASSSAAQILEEKPVSSVAAVTSEVVPTSYAVPVVPSSTPEPVVSTPTPEPEPEVPSSTPEPEPTPTPTPEPVTPAPEPSSTPAPAPEPSSEPAPAPAPSSTKPEAPAQTESSGGSGSGESYTGSLTMNYYQGGTGACGEAISDTDMAAALAVEGFGASSYDVSTGNPTNKWCNQKIRITYNGNSADAVIKDRCAGCTGIGGLDATPALWEALTGGIGGSSGDRLETGMSFTLIN